MQRQSVSRALGGRGHPECDDRWVDDRWVDDPTIGGWHRLSQWMIGGGDRWVAPFKMGGTV